MTSPGSQPAKPHDTAEVKNSGSATASQHGVANSGMMGHVFTGVHHHYAASAQTPDWPVLIGHPPPLASAFQPRRELRDRVLAASGRGDDIVLTQRDSTAAAGTQVLAGGGGVGKSQLAAWFARQALDNGTDLVVWVNASSLEQLTAAYALAAERAGVPGADGTDTAGDASAFLQWLHTTDCTWLVVLDDVTDAAHLVGRWPPRRPGRWTLATTRLRQASLTGSGRHRIEIDTFTPDESAAYLRDRLTTDDCAHLLDDAVPTLAAALGHLPLALSHAAAYMLDQHETCAAYLARYTAGYERLDELMPEGVDPDEYGRPVAVALLLALDAADAKKPVGLARPALALAAVLDPDGHPDDLWTAPAVADYLTAHHTSAADGPVTPQQARTVLRTLHNYGLVVHTPNDGHQAVRIHALTARAARETTDFTPSAVRTAADALLQLWPANDHNTTDLLTTLIANANTVAAIAGDRLWYPGGSALLYTVGMSLLRCGQHTPATKHWREITVQAHRILGEGHPSTLIARGNLASSYWLAGRTGEAIEIVERVVADCQRLLGEEHPETLTARGNLASSYRQAGRIGEAIEIEERVVADRLRLLGEEHPDTLTARGNLARSYWLAGRTGEAIEILERVVADRQRLLGEEHPDTLTARGNLAGSYWQAGRIGEAIEIEERVAADCQRLLGEEHPDSLTARANLASSYRQAGRTVEAIEILERVVADCQRLLGEEHPDTLIALRSLEDWQAEAAGRHSNQD